MEASLLGRTQRHARKQILVVKTDTAVVLLVICNPAHVSPPPVSRRPDLLPCSGTSRSVGSPYFTIRSTSLHLAFPHSFTARV
jgi:hypothetical protein